MTDPGSCDTAHRFGRDDGYSSLYPNACSSPVAPCWQSSSTARRLSVSQFLVKAIRPCHRLGMTADVTVGGNRLGAHPLRAAVVGEVHARPFTPIETPRRVLHFAFDTTPERGEADRAALAEFCKSRGLAGPQPQDKQLRVVFGAIALRWEQHSEFTTYTWELPSEPPDGAPFHPPATTLAGPMNLIPQPGPVLVAADLHLVAATDKIAPERLFDRARPAAAGNPDSTALYATDFKSDPTGFVRILIADRGLGPERAGALTQRVLELETYRTLALLGLPEAQRLAPSVRQIEMRLAEVTAATRGAQELEANQRLLEEWQGHRARSR